MGCKLKKKNYIIIFYINNNLKDSFIFDIICVFQFGDKVYISSLRYILEMKKCFVERFCHQIYICSSGCSYCRMFLYVKEIIWYFFFSQITCHVLNKQCEYYVKHFL